MIFAPEYFESAPFLAILRGVSPDEVLPLADALVEAGVRAIEVPLNSPRPFDSISRLAETYGASVLVGAGTVLSKDDVGRVRDAGGRLIVSPNCDAQVIRETCQQHMLSLPGVFTPTEAFAALAAGAQAIKYFPAELGGPAAIRAWRAVLPEGISIAPTGGVTPATVKSWLTAGADILAIGSMLYKPGTTPVTAAAAARLLVAEYRSYEDEHS